MLLTSDDIVSQEIQEMEHKLEELQIHLKAKQKITKLQSAKVTSLSIKEHNDIYCVLIL